MYHADQIKILAMVQTTVKAHGVKALAGHLSVRPQTLYADVDPKSIGRRTNKLGLLDWLMVLSETKDLSSLDAANRLFGRISIPIPAPAEEMNDMDWMEYCAVIAKESGEAVAELAGSILDGKMDPEELQRCEKEAWDALEAFAELYLVIKNSRSKQSN
jgi:hypothetical protein